MNESDLREIERGLQIAIPAEYREMMLRYPDDWKEYISPSELSEMEFEGEAICNTAQEIIQRNIELRKNDKELNDFFPDWWKSFFLFGTNGGGGYFGLRLDGKPGVWIIGTDCGDAPEMVEETLEEFIEASIDRSPPEIVAQASANSALEVAFLGTWRPAQLEDDHDASDPGDWLIDVQPGQILFIPQRSEMLMPDEDARLAAYPYRFRTGLWMKSLKGKPARLIYEIIDVNEQETQMRLRWKDDDEYWPGDCMIQFQPDMDSVVLTTKKFHQKRFRDPIRWKRVRH